MKYLITIFDDDFTPFHFTEDLLIDLFNKTKEEANIISKEIEKNGSVSIPMFSHEITEAKLKEVKDYINYYKLNLKVILEEEK